MNPPNPQIPPPPYYQDDEITLKDLILKIRSFRRELWRKKIWILLIATLSALGFLGKAWLEDTTYTAGLSFMVAENGSSEQRRPMTPYGMDFGRVENNKITELARSGRIIHEILLKKVAVGKKYDFIANHIIDIYDLQKEWAEEPFVPEYEHLHLEGFYFTNDSIPSFTPREYRALNVVHELIAGNRLLGEKGVLTISYNDDTDIFRLNVEMLDETLSMRVLEAVFEELKGFYIEETIGRPERTFNMLVSQADSMKQVLIKKERQLAYIEDRDRNLTSNISGLSKSQIRRDLLLIEDEYGEVLRNKKSLEVLLSNERPDFQVIDRTFIPVKNEPSMVKSILIGSFLGLFLGGLYFISKKIIREAMAS